MTKRLKLAMRLVAIVLVVNLALSLIGMAYVERASLRYVMLGLIALLTVAGIMLLVYAKRQVLRLKESTQRHVGRSEKLASVGQLAAGVAHEINNPLTGVLTFAHLLRKKPNMTERDKHDLDLIIHEATRASEIVRSLLDFSRERLPEKEPLDVNTVIRRTLKLLLSQKSFQSIDVYERLGKNLPLVDGDANQLQQVLVNLSLNACAAMPNGGKLTISSRHSDGTVYVELADTGCGIASENLERIFEPFFSTNPVGKGTGLGLSVSFGIVEQHGGTLDVESEEGKGTTVTIGLPAERPQKVQP